MGLEVLVFVLRVFKKKEKKKKSIAKNRITHLTLLYFMWLILVMIVERCLELLVGFF